MRSHSLILWALSFAVVQTCETDEDCSLNGVCVNPGHSNAEAKTSTLSVCQCDPGWVGVDCGRLDLAPATRYTGYNNTNATSPNHYGPFGNSSWGGQILQDPKIPSIFHLFTSQFSHGCGLSSWRPSSTIIRAESRTGPQGPYQYADTVASSFRHNPDVFFSTADREYPVYAIGVDAEDSGECINLTYKDWPNNTSVASADDIHGWTPFKMIINSDEEQGIHAAKPSPFPLWSIDDPTSEIALGIKDYDILTAGSWNGTYPASIPRNGTPRK